MASSGYESEADIVSTLIEIDKLKGEPTMRRSDSKKPCAGATCGRRSGPGPLGEAWPEPWGPAAPASFEVEALSGAPTLRMCLSREFPAQEERCEGLCHGGRPLLPWFSS